MDTLNLYEFGAVFNQKCVNYKVVSRDRSQAYQFNLNIHWYFFYFLTFERLARPKDVIHIKSTSISPLLNPN